MLQASGALVGEVEQRLAPKLGPVDDGAERDVGAAKEVVGLGDDLDGELLVGAGVLHRAGGDVEDGDDRPELGDRQRLRRGEMVEARRAGRARSGSGGRARARRSADRRC